MVRGARGGKHRDGARQITSVSWTVPQCRHVASTSYEGYTPLVAYTPSLTVMSVKLSPILPDVQSGTDGLAGPWAYNAPYCLIRFLPLGPSLPLQPSPRGRREHTTGG